MKSQIGAARETTWGTYAAPNRHFEFVSETLNRNKRTMASAGLRAAAAPQLQRSNRRDVTGRDGTGNIVMEVGFDGFGLWFEHMLGAVDTTADGSAFEHVFSLGSLWGKSLTVQKGVERDDGTVVPYSFVGAKIPSWQLEQAVDGYLSLTVDIDARDVLLDQTLAPATFDDGNLAHFMQSSLLIGNEPIAAITAATISGTNPMRVDRYFLGSGGLKAQQRENGKRTVSGQFTAEFTADSDLVAAYHDDTPLALELSFVGGKIAGGSVDESITIRVDDIRLDGETPKSNGEDLANLTIPFTGLSSDGSGVTITLVNSDSSA